MPNAPDADKALAHEWETAKHASECESKFLRESTRYPLTAFGDINTYAIFAETFTAALRSEGRAGLIVPTGIATDDSTKTFFDYLVTKRRLVTLYDFENKSGIFPAVHRTTKFVLLTVGNDTPKPRFAFFATEIDHLADHNRVFTLSAEEIAHLNPNTRTCPVFRSSADAELSKKIFANAPILVDERAGDAGNPWGIRFVRMFDMSNDSDLFHTAGQLIEVGSQRVGANWVMKNGEVMVPLYEAKMFDLFDHRAASYESRGQERGYRVLPETSAKDHENVRFLVEPFYWVAKTEVDGRLDNISTRNWLLGFKDVSTPITKRSFVATLLPRAGVGNSMPLLIPSPNISAGSLALLVSNLSALPFDYVARQKIGRLHFNFFIVKQLPVLPPETYREPGRALILPRVLELTYTAYEVKPFAEDLGYSGSPFQWDADRRALLRAELDAYYAYLYGLTRDELRYILDPADVMGEDYPSETFRVLKNNEMKKFGEYRTRRLVLEAWDRMEAADLK